MRNRRMTLGPGSMGHGNDTSSRGQDRSGRQSIGFGRVQYEEKKPSRGRMSIATMNSRDTSMSMRKSSMSMSRSSSMRNAGQQDPRPFHDKRFVKECAENLLTFLVNTGYDAPISDRLIKTPSSRQVLDIITFMFRLIDPTFGPTARFEETIIQFFKTLNYPFKIRASSLKSPVGTGWVQILAALTWLIELLNYDERAQEEVEIDRNASVFMDTNDGRLPTFDQDDDDLDDDEEGDGNGISRRRGGLDNEEDEADNETLRVREERAFMKYLEESYRCFLSGEDDLYNQLEEEFVTMYERQVEDMDQQTQTLKEENDQLQHSMDELEARRAYLPQLTERKKDLQGDHEKFQELIRKLEAHREDVKHRLHDKETERASVRATLSELEEEILLLKERIASQELSAEDVERLHGERERIERELGELHTQRQALQSSNWEKEQEIESKLSTLNSLLVSYHEMGEQLALIPSTARNAKGKDYSIELYHEQAMEDGKILGKQKIKGSLIKHLQAIKESVVEKTRDMKESMLTLMDTEEQLDAQLADLNETLHQEESRFKQLEEMYEQKKQAFESMTENHDRILQQLKDKIQDMQHRELASMDEEIDHIQSQLYEVEATSQLAREEHDMLTEKLISAMMDVVSQVADYHERHATILSSLKMQYQSSLTTLFHGTTTATDMLEGDGSQFMDQADTSRVSLGQLSYLQTPAHLKGKREEEEDDDDLFYQQDGDVFITSSSSSPSHSVSAEEEELLKQHRSHLSFYEDSEEDEEEDGEEEQDHFKVQDVSAISTDLSFDSNHHHHRSSKQVGFASPSPSSSSNHHQEDTGLYSSPVLLQTPSQGTPQEGNKSKKSKKISTPFPSQQARHFYPVEEEEEEELSPVASRTRSSQKKKNKKKKALPAEESNTTQSKRRTPLSKSARKKKQKQQEQEQEQDMENQQRRRSLKPKQSKTSSSSSSRRKTTVGFSSSSPLRDTTNQTPRSQWNWETLAGETDMSRVFGKKAKITRTPPQQQGSEFDV